MAVSTLIVGIGGQGGQIVQRIANKVSAAGIDDVEFVVLDTDVNDLENLHAENARIATIQTSYRATVGAALDANKEAKEEWFPISPGLLGKSLTEGAGQVRAISRLAFDHAIENGDMRPLEKAIERLHALCGEPYEQSMRVMICGSLAGGTGSGIALPLAMYIRNFLLTRYRDQSTVIRGFFLEPDTFFDKITDEEERNNLRCNAYAVIREIDAFMRKQYLQDDSAQYRHVVFTAPQPGVGRRMQYRNLLPYNYVFLMDAMNLDGEHLPQLEDYLDHMSDIIYTQSIGVTSARANSTEDNFTRRLDQSQGRARYCGAGCSHLIYPYDMIKTYFGLKWSCESITGEWLEIDRAYRKMLKNEGTGASDTLLSRSKFYVREFDTLKENNHLFAAVSRGTRMESMDVSEGAASATIVENSIGEDYVASVLNAAENWDKNETTGLAASCDALAVYLKRQADMNKLYIGTAEIGRYAERHGAGWIDSIGSSFLTHEKANERYYSIVEDEVASAARSYGRTLFRISESDTNPLRSHSGEEYIERYISRNGGSGALHPLAVRYILSDMVVALDRMIGELEVDCNTVRDKLSNLQKKRKKEGERPRINEEKEEKGFVQSALGQLGFGKEEQASESEIGQAAAIGKRLRSETGDIDTYRTFIVQIELLKAAQTYVEKILTTYEEFFKYMEGQVPRLQNKAYAIESDPMLNGVKGYPTKYVCANKQCLDYLMQACPQVGSSADLPKELCADIYCGAIRHAALSFDGMSHEERAHVSELAFADLFQQTVVDFWTARVEDPGSGYRTELDKPILRAILDEARYTDVKHASDPRTGEAFLTGELLDTIEEAYDLALPYIMRPLDLMGEEKPSNFGSCIYVKGATEDLGQFGKKAEAKLRSLGGREVEEGEISRHELLFSRQIYGFRASHLPHYACEFRGSEYRPAGEYHQAYWDIASQLSPDTSRNRYITPHIDRHWHLISFLPDISDSYQRKRYEDIIRAFVYGLTARQFGIQPTNDGSSYYYLKTGFGKKQVELMVPNGTRCDKFYEVFEALQYDPQVVAELIERSDKSLELEINQMVQARPETCELVKNTGSRAFVERIEPTDVYEAIDAFEQDDEGLMGKKRLSEQQRLNYFSRCVNLLFKPSKESTMDIVKMRHSILEIPVYYLMSLPPTDLRVGEIEDMLDGIYTSVKSYFANFASAQEVDFVCSTYLREQYLLFEKNLVALESAFPGIEHSMAVSAVREKAISFFEDTQQIRDELSDAQEVISVRWSDIRAKKWELQNA